MSIEIDLSGQVVLVTGGTRGIGHATVERFLQAGARVAFCAPEADDCARCEAELGQRFPGDRVLARAADLRDRRSLESLLEAVTARWGRVDTLVCNGADFGADSTVDAVDCEVYERVLQANVVGNFHMCRIVLPQMVARGSGSLILLGSIVGLTTMPSNVPYATSKAAIIAMARNLAAAYADRGIRVNCISPGLIRTEASRSIWSNEALARSFADEKIPMKRLGQPDEIATACVFLASPLASYITGAILPVDGGRFGAGQSGGTRPQAPAADTGE